MELLIKRLVLMVLLGQAFRVNVNGLTKSIVATDPKLNVSQEAQMRHQVDHPAVV